MKILVLNAGSSSQKSCLYEITQEPPLTPLKPLWEGDADWTKEAGTTELKITANGHTDVQKIQASARGDVIQHLLQTLHTGASRVIADLSEIAVVGHRVVHGGPNYREPTLITPQVKAELKKLISFAPLHNPASLDGIEAAERALPHTPQIAIFDTSFHKTIAPEVATYPGPYAWHEQGIRRYGFHGISHQYCAQRSAQLLNKDLAELKIINCHLGNGASLAAIHHGQSIDTTMGFTPLEGLMMGTRSGTVDPSILIYLQREHGYSPDQLDHMLNKESGMQGITGTSGDMRQVEKLLQEGNARARLALDMYVYRIRYFIGALLATLGGLDVLTFAGGIGENDSLIRAMVSEQFAFLHLKIDQTKNQNSPIDQDIATPDSEVRVLVVHTAEDWQIAKECWRMQHIK